VLLFTLVFGTEAIPHEPFILARIQLQRPGDLDRLGSLGLDIIRVERGKYIEFVTHEEEIERLRGMGFEVQVLIEDMEAHYARGRKGDNFGAFHTYSETVDELDAIHTAYPHITTEKISLGTSHEGRDIWAIKVSDNPDLQEDEPEVLLDALHHAREVITVEVLLNTLNHLCENYGTDPTVTFLVDHRQIWFVPIVNPDGFVYNETVFPNGGGMWRKNRRDNPGSSWGVDPNRNYPYEWGGVGSSGDPSDDNYRGPYAGSEPEVQAMMNFIENHQFVTQNSYHSVVGIILIPWAYTNQHTADDSLFRIIGNEMARDSGYETGQPGEILYRCSGVTCDWSYGDTSARPKVYAFSTEVGGSGFWPLESEIPSLVQENLHSDLYLMQVAGPYPAYQGYAIQDGRGDGQVDPGESVLMTVTLKNDTPLFEAPGVSAVLRTDDAYVQLSDAHSDFGDIVPHAAADNGTDPYAFSVDPACPQGHLAVFELEISADGAEVTTRAQIKVLVGQLTGIYANDFESFSDWTEDPTHTASTGDFVRIDPNPTSYQPGDDTTLDPGIYAWITGQNENSGIDDVDGGISATRSPVIDLSTHDGAHLSMMYFHGQRDQGDDPTGDFFRIDLSNDGGTTYPINLVFFGDETTSAHWRSLELNLHHLIALSDQMRIRVQVSEGPPQGDIVEGGIDDVQIVAGSGNTAPPAPVPLEPMQGDTVFSWTPTLTVENVVDPDGDTVVYGFRVYGDSLLTDLVAFVDGIPPGGGTTSWRLDVPPASDFTYWWRSFAEDDTERSAASEPARFHFVSYGPPPVRDITIVAVDTCIALLWSPVAEAVGYVVYRDSLAGFSPGSEDSLAQIADTTYLDCDTLSKGYYVIRAVDAGGQKSEDSMQVGQFGKELQTAP
jgi:hypothetical protein